MDGSGLESSYQGKNQGDMLNIVQVERGKSVEINSCFIYDCKSKA